MKSFPAFLAITSFTAYLAVIFTGKFLSDQVMDFSREFVLAELFFISLTALFTVVLSLKAS